MSNSGIFWYVLSLVYIALIWIINPDYSHIVNYVFIGIHLIFLILLLFTISWVYFAILISFAFSRHNIPKQDKEKVRLIEKTMPQRFILSIFYVAAPIGVYLYHIHPFTFSLVFKYYFVWFPFIYVITEYLIRKKEKAINSPVLEYDK